MAINNEELRTIPLEQRHIIFRYLLNSHNGLEVLRDKKTTLESFLKQASKPVARPVQQPTPVVTDVHQREYNDCYTLLERVAYARENHLHKQPYAKDDIYFHSACEFICSWYLDFVLGGGSRIEKIRVYKALDRPDAWDPTGLTQYQSLFAKEFRDIIVSPQSVGLPTEGRRQFLLNGFKGTALKAINTRLVNLLRENLTQIKTMANDDQWKTAGVKYIFFKRKRPAGISELCNMPIPEVRNATDFYKLVTIYQQAQAKVHAKAVQHSIFRTKETQQFYEICCQKLDVPLP